MKKIMRCFTILTVLSMFSFGTVYANKCQDQADACYERCDDNWGGDTIFDGAGRVACKTGCALSEAGCVISTWF